MTDTKCNCQMAACTCGPPYEDEQRYVVAYSGQGDTEEEAWEQVRPISEALDKLDIEGESATQLEAATTEEDA